MRIKSTVTAILSAVAETGLKAVSPFPTAIYSRAIIEHFLIALIQQLNPTQMI